MSSLLLNVAGLLLPEKSGLHCSSSAGPYQVGPAASALLGTSPRMNCCEVMSFATRSSKQMHVQARESVPGLQLGHDALPENNQAVSMSHSIQLFLRLLLSDNSSPRASAADS